MKKAVACDDARKRKADVIEETPPKTFKPAGSADDASPAGNCEAACEASGDVDDGSKSDPGTCKEGGKRGRGRGSKASGSGRDSRGRGRQSKEAKAAAAKAKAMAIQIPDEEVRSTFGEHGGEKKFIHDVAQAISSMVVPLGGRDKVSDESCERFISTAFHFAILGEISIRLCG